MLDATLHAFFMDFGAQLKGIVAVGASVDYTRLEEPEFHDQLRTSVDGVWAAGDCAAAPDARFEDFVATVAVTQGPGLIGALLVGVAWAKAAAWAEGRAMSGEQAGEYALGER